MLTRRSGEVWVLGGVTIAAAVARFAALGTQSYWYDESITVGLVRSSLRGMLAGVHAHEATPPLYYTAAWFWAHAFGSGEAQLRSLSAVAGTLTIPVVYLVGRHLGGRRIAAPASILAALSPALIWYSQEARAYAVLVLLSAVATLFFLRALDGSARDLAAWAVASGLALATHYFAFFLVAAQAVWLLRRYPRRRSASIAVAVPAAVGVALVPLLLYQRVHGGTGWIAGASLSDRIANAAYFLAAGPGLRPRASELGVGPLSAGEIAIAGVAALVLGLAIARAARSREPRALTLLSVAAAVIVIPLIADLLGQQIFLDRNLLPAWMLLAVVAVAGLVPDRHSVVGIGVLSLACVGFLAVDLSIPRDDGLQRDDWRRVARELGPPGPDTRLIAVTPGWQVKPLSVYWPWVAPVAAGARVTEVDTIGYDGYLPGSPGGVRVASPGAPFRERRRVTVQRMTVVRYVAPRPELVTAAQLSGQGGDNGTLVFVQPGTPTTTASR